MAVEETAVDTAAQLQTCIEQQLCEVEMLQSIYTKDEIVIDSDCAPFVLAYCERSINGESNDSVLEDIVQQVLDELSLGFTLKLLIESHPVEVKCDLPRAYPQQMAPLIFVRTSGIGQKPKQAEFRKLLSDFIDGLDLGEPVIFSVLDWINDHVPAYVDSQALDVNTQQDGPCSFTRMWIYSHHIYSKFKRRDIISWASELSLHGFSMCGKPGMVCVEGHTEDVEEFWGRLRRLNWKRLVMKEREDMTCDHVNQLSTLYKFDTFKEMFFGDGKSTSRDFHSDIGHLRKFLQERGCSYIFEMYFGIDGGTQPADT